LRGSDGPLSFEPAAGREQPYVLSGTGLLVVAGEQEIARIAN